MPLVSKTFSEIITFTRASSATYFDSAGLLTSATTNTPRLDYNPATLAAQGLLIEEQRVNLLTYSSDFDNAAWTKTRSSVSANLVTSPTGAVDADKLVEDTTASASHPISSATITLSGTTVHSFSVFAKAAERTAVVLRINAGADSIWGAFNLSTGTIGTAANAGTGSGATLSIQSAGNGWFRCTLTGICSSTSTTPIAVFYPAISTTDPANTSIIYTGDGVSGIYLYGAQLEAGAFATSYIPSVNTFTSRASTGSFFDATGTLQSAAINVARNTYNPVNLAAQPFLLLEEARTNSIRNNTMVGAVAGTPGTLPTNWVSLGAGLGTLTQTIVATGTSAGISYIDVRISGTTSTSSFGIGFEASTQIAASVGQTWTNSVYLSRVGGTTANLTVNLRVSDRDAVGVNLAISSSDVTSTLTTSTSRFSLSRTLSAVGTAAVSSDVLFAFSSGVAIDITLRIGLPQLEQGAYATSVIPTTTTALTRAADISSSAQATRAADVASVNTLSPWYNASEGTLFTESLLTRQNAVANNQTATIRNASGSEIKLLYRSSGVTGQLVIDTGVIQADLTPTGVISANATVKMALAYATNNFAASGNAGAVVTDTSGTVPSGLDRMTLGELPLNGYLRRISYWPRKLSDAELQAITA